MNRDDGRTAFGGDCVAPGVGGRLEIFTGSLDVMLLQFVLQTAFYLNDFYSRVVG